MESLAGLQMTKLFGGFQNLAANDQAICWIPEFSEWGIGPLDSIGSVFRGLTGVPNDENDLGMPYDQIYTWKYWNGYWKTPGANDIKVQCKGNTYLDSKIVEFLISLFLPLLVS